MIENVQIQMQTVTPFKTMNHMDSDIDSSNSSSGHDSDGDGTEENSVNKM